MSRFDSLNWVGRFQSGETYQQIAKTDGVKHPSTVRNYLVARGVIDRIYYPPVNHSFFDVIDTQTKAYWFGFLAADGCVSLNPNSGGTYYVVVSVSARDMAHIAKLAIVLGTRKPRQFVTASFNKPAASVRVASNRLGAALIAKGVVERKTFDVNLVRTLDNVPDELMPHFIRGVFDGDGTISRHSQNDSTCTVKIAGQSRFINVLRDKLVAETGIRWCEGYQNSTVLVVYWSDKSDVLAIYKYLYKDATVFLERKRDRFDTWAKIILDKGFKEVVLPDNA